jgi:hypothetical protein
VSFLRSCHSSLDPPITPFPSSRTLLLVSLAIPFAPLACLDSAVAPDCGKAALDTRSRRVRCPTRHSGAPLLPGPSCVASTLRSRSLAETAAALRIRLGAEPMTYFQARSCRGEARASRRPPRRWFFCLSAGERTASSDRRQGPKQAVSPSKLRTRRAQSARLSRSDPRLPLTGK